MRVLGWYSVVSFFLEKKVHVVSSYNSTLIIYIENLKDYKLLLKKV